MTDATPHTEEKKHPIFEDAMIDRIVLALSNHPQVRGKESNGGSPLMIVVAHETHPYFSKLSSLGTPEGDGYMVAIVEAQTYVATRLAHGYTGSGDPVEEEYFGILTLLKPREKAFSFEFFRKGDSDGGHFGGVVSVDLIRETVERINKEMNLDKKACGLPFSPVERLEFLTPDGREETGLSALGMLQMAWNAEPEDLAEMDAGYRRRMAAFQVRVANQYMEETGNGRVVTISDVIRRVGRPWLMDALPSWSDSEAMGRTMDRMLVGDS